MGRCGNYPKQPTTHGEVGEGWEDGGITRDTIPARGEVGERWEDVGITRDSIPTIGEVGERWEDVRRCGNYQRQNTNEWRGR